MITEKKFQYELTEFFFQFSLKFFFCSNEYFKKPVGVGNDMRHEKTVSVSKIKPLWEPWEEDETPRKRFLVLQLGPRTTDAQRGNSLHCTAENSIPIPNF